MHGEKTDGSNVPFIEEMDKETLSYWLSRLILEVRKVDGHEYPPNTLHHIVCGIIRHVKATTIPGVDWFKDIEFATLRGSLDGEMKRLQSQGKGSTHKQAEPLSLDEEELMWEKKILGGHSPLSLLR